MLKRFWEWVNGGESCLHEMIEDNSRVELNGGGLGKVVIGFNWWWHEEDMCV